MKKVIEIDEYGFYVKDVLIDMESDVYPEFYTECSFPKDEDNEQLPFYKPKWNGSEWLETLSEEDISVLESQDNKLDELSLLKLQNKALSDRQEFLEDVISEIAIKVYA